MKKILTFSAALILGVCAFAGASHNVRAAKAENLSSEQETAMKALLADYIGLHGQYTKKTTMHLTPAAQGETQYFHAGANTLQRATYYWEEGEALLMGDYEGTFTNINSGYANVEGVLKHFRSEDNLGGLVAPANRTYDYTVTGKTMADYFYNLTDLKNSITAGDWVYSDGAYIHNINSLELNDGEYNDQVLKKFQYFAAPMLLQNKYFSWTTIRVVDGLSYLSIRLYSSSGDSGKSTKVGTDECLISEARIYKGDDLHPEESFYLKGTIGGENKWSSNDYEMTELFDLYVPEQYEITTQLLLTDKVKLFGNDTWYGFDKVENSSSFNDLDDDNHNIGPKKSAKYTFYLKAGNKVYIASEDCFYTMVGSTAALGSWQPANGLAMTLNAGVASASISLVAGTEFKIAVGHVWDGAYGASALDIQDAEIAVAFGGADNIYVNYGGNYTISLNLESGKIDITGTITDVIPTNYELTVAIDPDFASAYNASNPVTYVYAFKDGAGSKWYSLTDGKASIEPAYDKVIIVRYDPAQNPATAGNGGWDGKWNQTENITIDNAKSTITITGWGSTTLTYTYA